MTTPRAYVAACAYALVAIVGAVAVVDTGDLALRATVAGLGVLVHLLVAERVVARFVAAAASGADGAAVGRFVVKQLTALPLALLLVRAVGADAVGLGLGSLVLGAMVHAVVQALRASDVRLVALGTEA